VSHQANYARQDHAWSLFPFLDYGDAEQYRKRIEQVRRDFEDLKHDADDTGVASRASAGLKRPG
jgi:hypothetical protein